MSVRWLSVVLFSGFLAATYGCGKDDKGSKKSSGKSIGAPKVEPPVTRNVPKGLSSSSLHLVDSTPKEKALAAVKQLLSSGETGPATFIYRLKKVDERMAELDIRSTNAEVVKACLANGISATGYDVGGKLPGDEEVGMKFQCQEDITGSPDGIKEAQLAFGFNDETFFLMERTVSTNGNGIIVFAKSAMNGKGTEAWEISTDGDNADFKHIKAVDGVGVEATIAGSKTTGHDGACGLHVKSNDTYVYLTGAVSEGGGKCSETVTACYGADSGSEVELSNCTNSKLNTFDLISLTPTLVGEVVEDAKKIVARKIAGQIDFTKDVEVKEE